MGIKTKSARSHLLLNRLGVIICKTPQWEITVIHSLVSCHVLLDIFFFSPFFLFWSIIRCCLFVLCCSLAKKIWHSYSKLSFLFRLTVTEWKIMSNPVDKVHGKIFLIYNSTSTTNNSELNTRVNSLLIITFVRHKWWFPDNVFPSFLWSPTIVPKAKFYPVKYVNKRD